MCFKLHKKRHEGNSYAVIVLVSYVQRGDLALGSGGGDFLILTVVLSCRHGMELAPSCLVSALNWPR